jgi:hypothetical protein
MRGENDSWANAASALARALTPDYEGQMKGRIAASQIEQNYAGADANYALARERGAAAALSERELATWQQLDATFQNDGMTPDEREEIFVTEFLPRLGKVDGSNAGDWALAAGGMRGLPDDRMTQLQTGSGMAFGSTIGGTREETRNKNQQFLMEQSGLASREAAARDAELLPVYDPGKAYPTYVERPDAIGRQPVLSETDAKGVQMQGATMPGVGVVGTGGFSFEGTAMEAQAGNYIVTANQKVRSGQPLSPTEQMYYDIAFNNLYGVKTEMRQGVDGQLYPVQIQPPVPPGIMPPGGAMAPAPRVAPAPPAGAQSGAFAPPPGSPRPGLSYGLPAASVGLPRPPVPTGPVPTASGPVAMPGPGGVTVGAPLNTGTKPLVPPTEAAVRQTTLGDTFTAGVSDLAALTGYDPATNSFPGGGEFPSYWTDFTGNVEQNYVGGLGRALSTDWDTRYRTVAFNVVEPILRLRTGAAAPDTEQLAYKLGLLPQSGISDQENQFRIRKLFQQVEIYAKVGKALGLEPEELFSRVDMNDPLIQEVRRRAEAEIAATGSKGPATPGTTDRPPGVAPDPNAGLPSTIMLPGGLEVEVLDWGN